jgi:hypothetical protein
MKYIIKVKGHGAGEKRFTDTVKKRKLAESLLNRKSKNRVWYADDEEIPVSADIAKAVVDKELASLKEQMEAFEKEKADFQRMKDEQNAHKQTRTTKPKKDVESKTEDDTALFDSPKNND